MNKVKRIKPGYLWSVFSMKCPRCRRGSMFTYNNPFRKLNLTYIFKMPETCSVCSQKYELETGFWYGTGYVSYALAVAFSVATFIAWLVLIGVSVNDNRVFGWLILNIVYLIYLLIRQSVLGLIHIMRNLINLVLFWKLIESLSVNSIVPQK